MIKRHSNYFVLAAAVLLAIFAVTAVGQSSAKSKQSTGTISGSVTLEGKPVAGVPVVINPCENRGSVTGAPAGSATTDADGNYRITAVPAGHYCVNAFTPAWVAQAKAGFLGLDLNIASGETVDGINLSLIKGGVITGRVLDTDGEPVILENVQADMYAENGNRSGSKSVQTDDRGIYRIYGLTPGKYKVQAGISEGGGSAQPGHRTHPTTYYADEPGVTEASKAKVINVGAEDESSDIDVIVQSERVFSVSGKVVSEQTGQPIPGVKLACSIRDAQGRPTRTVSNYQFATDAKGGFALPAITAGHYLLRVTPTDGFSLYSDYLPFDVRESNVTGLTLTARVSASVSGIVVFTNTIPQELADKVSKLSVIVSSQSPDKNFYSGMATSVRADGTFRVDGLAPGNTKISLNAFGPTAAFKTIRIERAGTEIKEPFTLAAGEAIADIRIIVGIGTGTVHGTVKIEGVPIPANMYIRVLMAAPFGQPGTFTVVEVDARGHFTVANLLPGQYSFQISTTPAPARAPVKVALEDAKKTVQVPDGADVSVTLTIVLSELPPKAGTP